MDGGPLRKRDSKEGESMFRMNRAEALGAARRLMRGFAGAPDPRRHAQQFHSVLVHAEGWSKPQQDLIVALGIWLAERPHVNDLKRRCEETLARLI
ncbi:hypothetical protein CC_2682 [Caulobacter vibrioides CB15]|uniref:Uncharacterized protein n=2 Tax=Caulobacter vibrioides TaxID=155892 RepID=Q9A4Z0_CAUVC|nr:hypothetical protein CC_2682 [Caulobacter vibrioides CB15]